MIYHFDMPHITDTKKFEKFIQSKKIGTPELQAIKEISAIRKLFKLSLLALSKPKKTKDFNYDSALAKASMITDEYYSYVLKMVGYC